MPFGEFVGLALAFVPQTYVIYANDNSGTSKLAGTINHRKNPIVVKLDLDTSGAEVVIDGRIPVAVVALLSVIDASKG